MYPDRCGLSRMPYEYRSVSDVQLALWATTEEPPRSEVQCVFGVTESALEDAEWLLRNIGIDPNQKRLFRI